MSHRIALALAAVLVLVATPARALFHLWEVTEIFSNADGTIQFVEFFTEFSSQQSLAGHLLQTEADDLVRQTFTFPADLPAGTQDRFFLVATADFAAAAGIAPDYVIPDGFLEPGVTDEVVLVGADGFGFDAAALPTDGVSSLNDPGGGGAPFADAATPTNFAGETGILVPEPGALASGATALAVLGVLRRRREAPAPGPPRAGRGRPRAHGLRSCDPTPAQRGVSTLRTPPLA